LSRKKVWKNTKNRKKVLSGKKKNKGLTREKTGERSVVAYFWQKIQKKTLEGQESLGKLNDSPFSKGEKTSKKKKKSKL